MLGEPTLHTAENSIITYSRPSLSLDPLYPHFLSILSTISSDSTNQQCSISYWKKMQGNFPGGLVVKTLPSNAGGAGLTRWSESRDPTCLIAKKQNTEQKQCCNKLKTVKMVHIQKRKKERRKHQYNITDNVTWANSGRWWRTGKPKVLQSLESQRVKHCGRLNKASEVVYGRPLLPSGGLKHKSTTKEFLALKTSTPQSTGKPAVPG